MLNGHSQTILFIDGDSTDRQRWMRALKQCESRYTILEAPDGKSGLDVLEYGKVDCMVLELALPDMSGFEVLLRVLPEAGPRPTAVVVLTRLASAALTEIAVQTGAHAYLVKGETAADELHRVILDAVAKRQGQLCEKIRSVAQNMRQ